MKSRSRDGLAAKGLLAIINDYLGSAITHINNLKLNFVKLQVSLVFSDVDDLTSSFPIMKQSWPKCFINASQMKVLAILEY